MSCADQPCGGSAGMPGTTGAWVGQVIGLGTIFGSSATPLVMDFVNDTSGTAFGGDYTPGASSVMPTVPAGLAPYPVDQLGRAIPNDGSEVAGAIQRA